MFGESFLSFGLRLALTEVVQDAENRDEKGRIENEKPVKPQDVVNQTL